MYKSINALCALLSIFFSLTSMSYALGLGNDSENIIQAAPPSPHPIQHANLVPAVTHAIRREDKNSNNNQNNMAAVGYHALPQNLTPQDPVVIAKETGVPTDCEDSTGPLRSQGAFGEQTVCPDGYLPRAIESTDKPTGSFFYRVVQEAVGTVYYRLRCCRAHVTYAS